MPRNPTARPNPRHAKHTLAAQTLAQLVSDTRNRLESLDHAIENHAQSTQELARLAAMRVEQQASLTEAEQVLDRAQRLHHAGPVATPASTPAVVVELVQLIKPEPRVLAIATPPRTAPELLITEAMGLGVLAAALGLVVATGMDQRIRRPAEAAEAAGVTLIAAVPSLSSRRQRLRAWVAGRVLGPTVTGVLICIVAALSFAVWVHVTQPEALALWVQSTLDAIGVRLKGVWA